MQKIYSVIHAETPQQIYRNIQRSIDAKADGSFIIDHGGIVLSDMLEAFKEAKQKFKGFFLGVNLLGVDAPDTFRIAATIQADALWVDEPGIYPPASTLPSMDEGRKLFPGQYFGSVAFKTQRKMDPVAAAIAAIDHVDVVTTSGPGTAKAPDVAKIDNMKLAIGDKPLAIASGMTPDNIYLYNKADIILVASGVQDTWTELDPDKLKLMVYRKRK